MPGVLTGLRTATTTGEVERPDHMAEGLQMERLVQKAIGALDEDIRVVTSEDAVDRSSDCSDRRLLLWTLRSGR